MIPFFPLIYSITIGLITEKMNSPIIYLYCPIRKNKFFIYPEHSIHCHYEVH